MKFTLREVCENCGVTRRAVQGYEKYGLVSPAGKNERGHLLYDIDAQKRIKEIKFYQDMGLTIKKIADIIDADQELKIQMIYNQIGHKESDIEKERKLIETAYKKIREMRSNENTR